MKIVAAMNVRNELGRYLAPMVSSLLVGVDELRVQDDGSDDGTFEWLEECGPEVQVRRNVGLRWDENEGELHQSLLDWTLEARPTHVLAIDADEIVPEIHLLRERLAEFPHSRAFTLNMVEIWRRDVFPWLLRRDGGWRPHPVAIAWRVPRGLRESKGEWAIWGRKLAGGRVPRKIRSDQRANAAADLGLDILHLGWSDPDERKARHRRYVELDGGRYHAGAHLDSIMLPDSRCDLEPYEGTLGVHRYLTEHLAGAGA